MKHQLDIKSILIGFLSAALLITTISFKNNGNEQDGKFKALTGENGIVILDTQTGAYILTPFVQTSGRMEWIKGDFYNTHNASKDNKKEFTPQ